MGVRPGEVGVDFANNSLSGSHTLAYSNRKVREIEFGPVEVGDNVGVVRAQRKKGGSQG